MKVNILDHLKEVADFHRLFLPREECVILLKKLDFTPDYILEYHRDNLDIIPALLLSQVFRFFRDKYNLRHSIMDFVNDSDEIEWDYEIATIGTDLDEKGNYIPLVDFSTNDPDRKFKTYEEAELACARKLIDMAIKNKVDEDIKEEPKDAPLSLLELASKLESTHNKEGKKEILIQILDIYGDDLYSGKAPDIKDILLKNRILLEGMKKDRKNI